MNIKTKRGSLDNIVTYEHYCDTIDDLQQIPLQYTTLGSVAIVLQGQNDGFEVYMANSNHEWVSLGTGGGGEGGSGDKGYTEVQTRETVINSETIELVENQYFEPPRITGYIDIGSRIVDTRNIAVEFDGTEYELEYDETEMIYKGKSESCPIETSYEFNMGGHHLFNVWSKNRDESLVGEHQISVDTVDVEITDTTEGFEKAVTKTLWTKTDKRLVGGGVFQSYEGGHVVSEEFAELSWSEWGGSDTLIVLYPDSGSILPEREYVAQSWTREGENNTVYFGSETPSAESEYPFCVKVEEDLSTDTVTFTMYGYVEEAISYGVYYPLVDEEIEGVSDDFAQAIEVATKQSGNLFSNTLTLGDTTLTESDLQALLALIN